MVHRNCSFVPSEFSCFAPGTYFDLASLLVIGLVSQPSKTAPDLHGTGPGRGAMKRQTALYYSFAALLVLLLNTAPTEARRLMEFDGIELRGTARVLTYDAATCHVLGGEIFRGGLRASQG